MCGIAGFYNKNLATDKAQQLAEDMLHCIKHRGPDAGGVYAQDGYFLGHNRLSIIDLSEEANQPFHYGDLCIVFNGEVYNYVELKEELIQKGYSFRTTSDTEVVMAAYQEYGEACVERFVGMWSLALLNKKTNELFCSRDRFGIKPFYYFNDGTNFAFASEQKALYRFPGVSKNINPHMVSAFLQLGMVDGGEETFLLDIKSMPAAHNLTLKNGELSITKYWNLSPTFSAPLPEAEAVQEFQRLLKQSVRLHSRSDVTVGACLSGGLDSSALSALMVDNDESQRVKAFHIYYTGEHGVDESNFAQMVVDAYSGHIELHKLSPQEKDVTAHFADFMRNMESPVPSSSPYSQYFVMKLAASHNIKVVIDGQGADEYMAGYKHAIYRFLHDEIKNNGLSSAKKQFDKLAEIKSIKPKEKIGYVLKTLLTFFFSENRLYDIEYNNALPKLSTAEGKITIPNGGFKGRLQNFLYHQLNTTSLNNLLYYEDRNSMRFSIESRVPFLDHRLAEFVLNQASNLILKDGWSKYILRESIAPYLPKEITYRRDKKGFVTPGEITWLNGPLKEQLMENKWTFPTGMVHEEKAEKLRQSYLNGDRSQATMVWRLAVLSYWYTQVLPVL